MNNKKTQYTRAARLLAREWKERWRRMSALNFQQAMADQAAKAKEEQP